MINSHNSINYYFSEKLSGLVCDEITKSYIVSIFSKYKTAHYDLSKDSITLQYSLAKSNNDFEKFQTVGDWIFFINAIFPDALKNASKDYYYSIGQLSYFNCYRMVRQFKIYELLADNFIILSKKSGEIILNQ